jgi:hypothetical protein
VNELESLIERARRHEHRLISRESAHQAVHGTGWLENINKWLALLITKAVGTMWCAYAFALLALISLPGAIQSHSIVILVSWLSQTFLQLVLLSIIIVGQNVIQEASDQRAEADHETLQLLHKINLTQLDILTHVQELVSKENPNV